MTETRAPYITAANEWDTIRRRLETAAKSIRGLCVVSISVVAINGAALLLLLWLIGHLRTPGSRSHPSGF